MSKKIVLLEAFSGIGGFAYGLIKAGFEIEHHLFSEIDEHAIANYKYNFPNAEYIGSVVDISGYTIRERFPDKTILVTFGFPCQDISIAGKRKGLVEGTRSSLLFQAGRIITESKAQIYIAENVKGLSSVNEGRSFYEALRFLTFFGTDSPQYNVELQLLNTAWVLPQNRERYYFVGHIGTGSFKRIFPITESDFEYAQGVEVNNNVLQINPSKESGGVQPYQQNRVYDSEGIVPSIDGVAGRFSVSIVASRGRGENWKQTLEERHDGNTNSLTSVDKDNMVLIGVAGRSEEGKRLRKESMKNGKDYTPFQAKKMEFRERAEINTITAATQKDNTLMKGSTIRRLTEIECERLQGFPDNWTMFGNYKGEIKKIAKTQRYKMCGNAVTTEIVTLIGKKLLT